MVLISFLGCVGLGLRIASLGRGRRLGGLSGGPVERFGEGGEVEIDGLGQAARAIPGFVVRAGLGAHDPPVGGLALLVGHRFQIAVKNEIDHPQHDLAGLVGQGRNDPGVLAGAGLDLPLHRMGDEKQSVGQKRQLGEDAVELVVDQRPTFAVAQIRLVLDLELGADVLGAHPVGVVDRVDDDGLEGVLAFGDLAAGGQ